MNILFLSYNGLLEPIIPSQAVPYLKGLAKKGYRFVLLTYEKRDDLESYGRAGIKRIREDLKKDGIEWVFLKYHKIPPGISTLYDLFIGIFFIFYLARKHKIKMIHIRGITPGIMVLVLLKFVRIKVLFDMRGLLAEEYVGGGMWKEGGPQFNLVKAAEKSMLMKCDAVSVLTKKHFELNKSLGYFSSRNIPMEVIPCCVDTEKFTRDDIISSQARKSLGLNGKFVLMYPGKIGSFYFIDKMVDFFGHLSDIIPESVFFIITRDNPETVINRANELKIPEDKFLIRKGVSFDEMPFYTRLADAGIFFINPYKKIGSSPIKLGEFLACGVPVVINPGVGDSDLFVSENKAGVIVNRFEREEYRRAVHQLSHLIDEGDVLKERCVLAAKRYLSKDMAIDKYAAIYGALMGR